ncbi:MULTISPECIES: permease [Lysinibacillus]|uniref:Permease n=1 Tax=Lysinibacillus antri TaxID=2498145 RepID=A0A432L8J4_9BACI|nr:MULTISPECIES: permease [Lysinibacillus]RUL49046.1 permease [Lysinibacillus antri]TSI04719.1 permease [Lysinibacillus sp. BW-2-10]
MQHSHHSSGNMLTMGLLIIFLIFVLINSILPFNESSISSFQQLNTIFLSILIEAIPFVLIGVLISGFIQIFITEDHIRAWIPKNKAKAVFMSCVVGSLFPACECGIVPIVRRLISKGVPLYAGIGFLLTGPLINPIVILSTYMAFGNDFRMALMRMGIGFIAAFVIAFIIGILFNSNQLKHKEPSTLKKEESIFNRVKGMLHHSVDEFFDMSKYLIIGAFVASALQVYVSMQSFLLFEDNIFYTSFVMMGLAYFLSLCSEADAFIGASFRNLFPSTSILAFLVYGPMIDLKNTIMLLSVFKAKFVFILFILITSIVFIFVHLTTFI